MAFKSLTNTSPGDAQLGLPCTRLLRGAGLHLPAGRTSGSVPFVLCGPCQAASINICALHELATVCRPRRNTATFYSVQIPLFQAGRKRHCFPTALWTTGPQREAWRAQQWPCDAAREIRLPDPHGDGTSASASVHNISIVKATGGSEASSSPDTGSGSSHRAGRGCGGLAQSESRLGAGI